MCKFGVMMDCNIQEVDNPDCKPCNVQVLHSLPFLKYVPPHVFDWVLRRGRLIQYDRSQAIWSPKNAARTDDESTPGFGINVVLTGLIQCSFRTTEGGTQVCISTLVITPHYFLELTGITCYAGRQPM